MLHGTLSGTSLRMTAMTLSMRSDSNVITQYSRAADIAVASGGGFTSAPDRVAALPIGAASYLPRLYIYAATAAAATATPANAISRAPPGCCGSISTRTGVPVRRPSS